MEMWESQFSARRTVLRYRISGSGATWAVSDAAWPIARVADVATVLNGYPFDSDLFTTGVGEDLVRIRDISESATSVRYAGEPVEAARVHRDDVLVGMDGDFNVARWRGGDALLNQRVCCIRAKSDNDSRFLAYALPDALNVVNRLAETTTVRHLSSKQVGDIRLGLPPAGIQRAIADYLDVEVARVDELVAEKQCFIELLAERRVAVTTHAVTNGLTPVAETKASGADWLGHVPEHWEVLRARYLLANRDDRSTDGSEELLTVSHITGVTARSAKKVHMFLAETNEGYKKCLEGDLVVNTMWAFAGAAGVTRLDGLVSPSYNVYRFMVEVDSEYFDHLSRCRSLVGEFDRRSKGIVRSRLRLYPDQLLDIRLPIPPLAEQRTIAAYLDAETAAIDELTDTTRQSIDLLKEYRTALISAAVTGQIDVSSMATQGESA